MKKVFKYGFFAGMDPVCAARLSAYPELEYVRSLTPEQLLSAPQGDLEDAQHQWVTSYRVGPQGGFLSAPMQHCGEEECTAVRPTPLDLYPDELKMQIMRMFMMKELNR